MCLSRKKGLRNLNALAISVQRASKNYLRNMCEQKEKRKRTFEKNEKRKEKEIEMNAIPEAVAWPGRRGGRGSDAPCGGSWGPCPVAARDPLRRSRDGTGGSPGSDAADNMNKGKLRRTGITCLNWRPVRGCVLRKGERTEVSQPAWALG